MAWPAALAVLLGTAATAGAQSVSEPAPPSRLETFKQDTSRFFGGLFDRKDEAQDERSVRTSQLSATDVVVRLERLENQMRQLTGAIEKLQFRNQQLEQQLRQVQEDAEYRFRELGAKGGRPHAPPPSPQARLPQPQAPQPAPAAAPPAVQEAAGVPGRRSDAFDPAAHPGAPGSPHVLGQVQVPAGREPMVGAPGGRAAGEPLDLSTLSARAANDPNLAPGGALPPPPPRNPSSTGAGQQMVMAPSKSPKDEFDLAYGYMLHKDYALAEESFRLFLRRHGEDRLAADAHYWLGESLFQRQRYRDAAESFLTVSTKFERSAHAPEALLRLAQSLAALKEKEAACATFGEVGRKYPRAPASVKHAVEREQKRVGC